MIARWLCAKRQNGTRFVFQCLGDNRKGLGPWEVLPSGENVTQTKAVALISFPSTQDDLPKPWKIILTEQKRGNSSNQMILAKPVILLPLNANHDTFLKLDIGHTHILALSTSCQVFWRLQDFHSASAQQTEKLNT